MSIGAVAIALVVAACSPEQDEAYKLVNESRSHAGLAALAFDGALGQAAQRHAEAMAARGKIFHEVAPAGSCITENVGTASTISGVHSLFLESAVHRGNILAPTATAIGTGVAIRDGRVYVVERFVGQSC